MIVGDGSADRCLLGKLSQEQKADQIKQGVSQTGKNITKLSNNAYLYTCSSSPAEGDRTVSFRDEEL